MATLNDITAQNGACNQPGQRPQNLLDHSNEVTFPSVNVGSFVEYRESRLLGQGAAGTDDEAAESVTIELTGERGYRTCLAGHGVKHGDFYFEVEMLAYRTPTPFVDVVPAVRVGLSNFAEQSLEMPIGATKRSYAYSSTGKMIHNAKFSSKRSNEPYSKCKPIDQ